jgi:hypothetical protein
MNRCNAGGIALSWVPSKYQHGSVFHASGPAVAGVEWRMAHNVPSMRLASSGDSSKRGHETSTPSCLDVPGWPLAAGARLVTSRGAWRMRSLTSSTVPTAATLNNRPRSS